MREVIGHEATWIGQSLSIAIAAILFGSTMILSAVGPARAGETAVIGASQSIPSPSPYLA